MEQFHINEEVLTAYLKGELDAGQAAQVEAWYDASAANRKMLGEVYYLLFMNDRLNDAAKVDVERSLSQLKARMHTRRPAIRPLHRLTWRIAAAAVIAAAVIAGGWNLSSLSERLSKPIQVFTQLGERSQVVLPDGTKVWLNSCSQVEYTSPLFSRKRLVSMSGEAYFEVARNEHSPFIVSADGLNIKVLGTKFNIRTDADHYRVTSVLLEGSVQAYSSDNAANSLRMRPLQSVVFDTRTKRMELSDCIEAGNSINWIDGRLHFNQMPFSQIAEELRRYYNAEVIFHDEALRKECFSGDFMVSDGIYHIMSVLSLTYKFQYRIVDNDIILYANTTNR